VEDFFGGHYYSISSLSKILKKIRDESLQSDYVKYLVNFSILKFIFS
jgi:hypothetical protein